MIEGNPLCHINKPFLESLFQKKETYHTDWFSALGGAGIVPRLRLSWTSWVENKNHLGANAGWEVAVRMAHDHLISLYSSPRVIHSLYFMYWYDRFFSCPSHKGLVKSRGRCIGSLGAKWPIWEEGLPRPCGALLPWAAWACPQAGSNGGEESHQHVVSRISLAQGSAVGKRFETRSSTGAR